MKNSTVSFYLFLVAIFFVYFSPIQTMAMDGPGVYCASKITSSSPNAANELRQSGFEWVCVWTLHIYPDGHLVFNSEYDVTNSSGTFVANQFATEIARLKAAPTSIEWVEVGLSGWGSGSFDAVKDLVNSEGTGPNSSLYKNFKALYDAVPQIDALSIDDESTYDEPSTTQFAIMLADIGFKVSICPYTQANHWQNVVANTNAARPGTIEDVHLQCYAGGSGNNPCTWDGYFAPEINVMPGVEPGNVASKMSNWNNQCGIAGGWIWAYDDYYGQLSTVQGWATDIANNISGGTPPPPTVNNVAPDASVSVSSEYPDATYSKEKLNDEIKVQHANGEWASNGETTPWAKLSWNQGITTSKVILYDRPNSTDQISSGTLTFSDGSSVSVGALLNNGEAEEVTFSERTITWVKFQVDNGSGYNVGLSEFEVVGEYTTVPPVTNIALNKSVTASSVYGSGYEARKAVDGDASSTRWASGLSNSEWIYVDLQDSYSINRVVIEWEEAYGKDFTIQVSNDASNWTTIKTVTNNSSTTNDFSNLAGTGRYVRMNGTAYGPYSLYSIWEFEVYGTTLKSAEASIADLAESEQPVDVKIYPIPVKNLINIELGEVKNAQLTIFDMRGRLVYKNVFNNKIQINKNEISGTGMLFMEVKTETETYLEKIIIR